MLKELAHQGFDHRTVSHDKRQKAMQGLFALPAGPSLETAQVMQNLVLPGGLRATNSFAGEAREYLSGAFTSSRSSSSSSLCLSVFVFLSVCLQN